MDENGLTQRGLAKRAGVSQRGVGYLLKYHDQSDRHASLDTVEAIGRAFGIDPLNLLSDGPGITSSGGVAREMHHEIAAAAETSEPRQRPDSGAFAPPLNVEKLALAHLLVNDALRRWDLEPAGASELYASVYESLQAEESLQTVSEVIEGFLARYRTQDREERSNGSRRESKAAARRGNKSARSAKSVKEGKS